MRRDRVRKNIWTLFPAMLLCMTGCAAEGNEAVNGLSCKQAECAYELKQIAMFDKQTGWALSMEDEVLFTSEGVENFAVIREKVETGEGTEGFINACFVNEETAYLVYFVPDGLQLVVESTGDGEETWQKTQLDYNSFDDTCDAGSAYISFTDDQKGYLIYCSTPGAGLMTKMLLGTEDGGRGMIVLKEVGDKPSFQLFTTEDGGDNWMRISDVVCGEVKAYCVAGDTGFFLINELGELYEAEK